MIRAVRAELRPAVEDLVLAGNVGPKYYEGSVSSGAAVPYVWIHDGGDSATVKAAAKYESQIYLEIYGRGSLEAATIADAVEFLDDHNPAPYGNAESVRYELASRTQLSEAENREHITCLYRVTYADARKLI